MALWSHQRQRRLSTPAGSFLGGNVSHSRFWGKEEEAKRIFRSQVSLQGDQEVDAQGNF